MSIQSVLIILLLSKTLVKQSNAVINQKRPSELGAKNEFFENTEGDNTDSFVNKNSNNSVQSEIGNLERAFSKGTKTINETASSVFEAFSNGLGLLVSGSGVFGDKADQLITEGIGTTGRIIDRTKDVTRGVTELLEDTSVEFDSRVGSKENLEKFNHYMSHYLTQNKNKVDDKLGKENLMGEKYYNLYCQRCLQGDCLTFDNFKVADMGNNIKLFLPSLVQVSVALYLFRESVNNEYNFITTLLRRTNYNSTEFFILVLARHNLKKREFLNSNDEGVNTFYYKATLLYKKFTSESKIKNQLDSKKTLTTVLGFFVKSDLIKVAQMSTFGSDIKLDGDELNQLTVNFKNYLMNDSEEFNYLSDSYANLCRDCLQGSYEENMFNTEMMDYLIEGKYDADDICDGQEEECLVMLDKYVERCKGGDCYTLDSVNLMENIRLRVLMPNIPQAKLALRIFRRSKAHRAGNFLVGFMKRLFRMETHRTLRTFILMLAKHNVKMSYYNNEAEKVINRFLYQSTLFFVRFLTVSKLVTFYSLGKFTLWLFSFGRYKYLKELAKDITFGNKIVLTHDLSTVMVKYSDYLVKFNQKKLHTIARYFASMCREVVMKHVNVDKISADMFDTMEEIKPTDICGKSEKLDCPTLVQIFLDRCKNGDCYTLDSKNYFTLNRMTKLTLPILHQVDAAIYVFNNSSSNKGRFTRLVKSIGSVADIDPFIQFYRNLVNHNSKLITYKSLDNEVLNRYLFNSAVYYKFISDKHLLDSVDSEFLREFNHTSEKVEMFMNRTLRSLVGAERIRLKGIDLDEVFKIYRKYFYTTQVVTNQQGLELFIQSCHKVIQLFKSMQNDDSKFEQYVKSLRE
uniref:Rhoptry-associated protein, putative n=1 Tax=Theileria annulata TaxID=5874 RepID=A0A3B0N4Q4_THEAN